jgi:putative peptidoglycan lipid II flippase
MTLSIPSIFNHKSQTIEGGAFVIALTGVVGAFLGILRNAILASKFGATAELDAYFAAFRIPDFFYSILVFGALTAGFMPVFNRWLTEGRERGWELAAAMMNVLVLLLGIVAIITVIFARELVAIFAPGFGDKNAELVATLLRIMMLQPVLLAISNVAAASLQSFGRFFISSLAPLFYNLGIIIGALWLVEVWGINGLALGVVLGAMLHLLVQVPTLLMLGFKWSPGIRSAWRGIWEIFTLTLPRMANLIVAQFNLFAITALASILPAGTLSVYNFAADLAAFPQNIFGLSFATAVFPTLARLWAENKIDEYRQTVSRTLSEMWFWITAAALVVLLLRAPLVRLTLVFGAFGEDSYLRTLNTITIFLAALPGQAGVLFLIRAFFAMGNTVMPLIAAILGSMVTISVSFWFGRAFGAAGVALGPALAGFLQSAVLLVALRRILGSIGGAAIIEALRNALILGISSGVSGWLTLMLLERFMPGQEFFVVLSKFLIAGAVSLGVFAIGYFGLRVAKVTMLKP